MGVGGRTRIQIFDRLPQWTRDLSPVLSRGHRYRTAIMVLDGVAVGGLGVLGGLLLSRSSSTTVDAADSLRSIDAVAIDEPDGPSSSSDDVTPSSVLETTTTSLDATTVPSDRASTTATTSADATTTSATTTSATAEITTTESTTTSSSTAPSSTDEPPTTTTTAEPATTTTSSLTPTFRGWEGNLPAGGFLEQYVDESYADCYLLSHPSASASGCNEPISRFEGEFNIWMVSNHGHLVMSRWMLSPDLVTEVYLLNADGDRVDGLIDSDREHWVIDTTADFGPVTLFAHHADGVDAIPLPAPAIDADRIIITRPTVLG